MAADYVDVLSNGDLASGASRPPFLGTYVSRSMDRKGASNKWNTTGPYEIAISVAFIWSAGNDMPYPGRERPCHYTIWLPGLARLAYLSYPANSQVFGVKVAMASRP